MQCNYVSFHIIFIFQLMTYFFGSSTNTINLFNVYDLLILNLLEVSIRVISGS